MSYLVYKFVLLEIIFSVHSDLTPELNVLLIMIFCVVLCFVFLFFPPLFCVLCSLSVSNVCFLINTDGKNYNKYAGILHTGNGKHHIETGLLQLQQKFSFYVVFSISSV